MNKISRRNFFAYSSPIVFSLSGLSFCSPGLNKKNNPFSYGWTSCLTYETGNRRLGYDYFSNLLDEMSQHGMNHLLVMMASHGYYSPLNHGLAWPVKNPKLISQVDHKAVNALPETEFFTKIIEKAHRLNIKVFIEIKYLGLIGIDKGYPGWGTKKRQNGEYVFTIHPEADDYERKAIETLQICCDNTQTHQYMRDKITDVLSYYKNLDGIVLEHPSYSGSTCYCSDTRARLKQDTGKEIEELSKNEFREWKCIRIRDTLIDLKDLVKSINPDMQFGFYTGFSPKDGDVEAYQLDRGHGIETLKQVGLDYVMPYCEGRHTVNETREIQKVIEYLDPLPCFLHTTIRRDPPHNYKLPPKGPEYIHNIITWAQSYQKLNPRFRGMSFFNEVKLPTENRQAVYDSIQ